MYIRSLRILALAFALALSAPSASLCERFGPVSSIDHLISALDRAQDGDVILISGEVDCRGALPITSGVSVQIAAEGHDYAVLCGARLQDADISFSGVHLADSLSIAGSSNVHLDSNVSVYGADAQSALSFSGCGSLIIDAGSQITAGEGGVGVSISHTGGEFYASLEGSITGGSGQSGGAGVIVSPLTTGGVMLISGNVRGGDGTAIGGHAVNLHTLSGNAYVSVDGQLSGGSGMIGGDGLQLVSSGDNAVIGISGSIRGGDGESYGGDAIMLMNVAGASVIHLSGEFSGGNSIGPGSQPGTALVTVGDMTSLRARVDNCLLEDGRRMAGNHSFAQPSVTPLPQIESDSAEAAILRFPDAAE